MNYWLLQVCSVVLITQMHWSLAREYVTLTWGILGLNGILSAGLKTTVMLTQCLHYQCLWDTKGTLRFASIANSAGVLFTVLITQAWEEWLGEVCCVRLIVTRRERAVGEPSLCWSEFCATVKGELGESCLCLSEFCSTVKGELGEPLLVFVRVLCYQFLTLCGSALAGQNIWDH